MKKIIFTLILILILQTNYNANQNSIYGKYITFKDFEDINKCNDKIDIFMLFGDPEFLIKSKNKDIWVYYYQKKSKKKRTINRYIKIIFDKNTNKIISTSIFY